MPPPRSASSEPTTSIRMLWPFARLIGEDYFRVPEFLSATGLTVELFGDPDTRLPHSLVMRMLQTGVDIMGDPTLGLRAGQMDDQAEFDFVEFAARSKRTLGEAIHLVTRYVRIMDEAVDIALVMEGECPLWMVRPIPGASYLPAANDYILSSALAFSRRNATTYVPPLEVRLMHDRPEYAAEYERYFETEVVFGAPDNGILLHPSRLDVPMLRANPGVAQAFELQAARALERLRVREGVAGRVREVLVTTLADAPSMRDAARKLGMGIATLRRKLDAEGTTFSDLVDEVRRELADRHLSAADVTVSEVAFLLGFSDVRAFGRAFRRWYGASPSEYRAGRKQV